jgi:hypothetical protein
MAFQFIRIVENTLCYTVSEILFNQNLYDNVNVITLPNV